MPKGSWREFDDISSKNTGHSNEIIKSKIHRSVRVERTRGSRNGKTVTLIKGLDLDDFELRKLLKKLKKTCGTGGTVKTEIIELQGDQIKAAINVLQNEGYRPKQSGG